MLKVQQTIFNNEGLKGNCFTACVASILELPIEAVPNWFALYGEQWRDHAEYWLNEHGYALVSIRETALDMLRCLSKGPLVIITGTSPRGAFRHAVVGKLIACGTALQFIHDPHPDGTFLAEGSRTIYLLARR